MEHGRDADAGAEVLRVRRNGHHGLGRRAEQQVVDRGLVLPGDVGHLGRQGEDDVEVADRQEIGLALREPCPRGRALALGAVPVAAGVVGDTQMAAVVAALDMAAERGRPAVHDRRHDLELVQAQVPGMGGPVGWAGSSEDVGDLRPGGRHASAAGRSLVGHEEAELVERAGHGAHRAGRHPGVERRVVQLGVTEQRLDDADVDAVLEKVGGEAVPQGMRADRA